MHFANAEKRVRRSAQAPVNGKFAKGREEGAKVGMEDRGSKGWQVPKSAIGQESKAVKVGKGVKGWQRAERLQRLANAQMPHWPGAKGRKGWQGSQRLARPTKAVKVGNCLNSKIGHGRNGERLKVQRGWKNGIYEK